MAAERAQKPRTARERADAFGAPASGSWGLIRRWRAVGEGGLANTLKLDQNYLDLDYLLTLPYKCLILKDRFVILDRALSDEH